MSLVDPHSLAATLDAVNAAAFEGRQLSYDDRLAATGWLLGRQGLAGSYGALFAPTQRDFSGIKLFTGESARTQAGIACKLGLETIRALRLLDVKTADMHAALQRADAWVLHVLEHANPNHPRDTSHLGMYCCASCSVALWRAMAMQAAPHARPLASALAILKTHRDGKGRWQGFPFYYTLLAVGELAQAGPGSPKGAAGGVAAARAELQYASPLCEKLAARSPRDIYQIRRQKLAQKVLALA